MAHTVLNFCEFTHRGSCGLMFEGLGVLSFSNTEQADSLCFTGMKLSMVEHSPDKGEVGGSNPLIPIRQVEWKKVIAFGAVYRWFDSPFRDYYIAREIA